MLQLKPPSGFMSLMRYETFRIVRITLFDMLFNITQLFLCFLIISSQVGIHGFCHSAYVIEDNAAAKELYVTQNIDIKNCQQKAEIYQGMALGYESKSSREVCIISYLKVRQKIPMKYFSEIIHIHLLAKGDTALSNTVLYIITIKHMSLFREVKMWFLL